MTSSRSSRLSLSAIAIAVAGLGFLLADSRDAERGSGELGVDRAAHDEASPRLQLIAGLPVSRRAASAAFPANVETGELRGRVVDRRGRPVEGATLRLDGDSDRTGTRTTDAAGEFLWESFPAGSFELSISAPGHSPVHFDSVDVVALRDTLLPDIVLPRPGHVAGTVTDGAGAPIEGAEVKSSAETVTTDASGRYEVRTLADALVCLEASKDGFVAVGASPARVPVEEGARVEGIRLLLEPWCSISGRITDKSGAPIAGAWIGAEWTPEPGESEKRREDACSGPDGRYLLRAIPPQTFCLIQVHADRFDSQLFPAVSSGRNDVDFKLHRLPRIEIRGLDRATRLPVRDACCTVSLEGHFGCSPTAAANVSDRNLVAMGPGTWLCSYAGPGLLSATIEADGYEPETTPRIHVDGTDVATPLEVLLEKSARPKRDPIRGVVVRAGSGSPVGGAAVSLRLPPDEGAIVLANVRGVGVLETSIAAGCETAVTDAQGRFSFENEFPARPFFVHVVAPGLAGFEEGPFEAPSALTLRIPQAGALEGAAFDSDGSPLAQAPLVVWRSGGVVRTTVTDALGRYRVERLAPGSYRVAVGLRESSPSGDRSWPPEVEDEETAWVARTLGLPTPASAAIEFPARVEAGETARCEVRLGADGMGVVRGRLFDASGPLACTDVTLTTRSNSGSQFHLECTAAVDGSFVFPRVPPGLYVLNAGDGLCPSAFVSLAVGAGRTIRLDEAIPTGSLLVEAPSRDGDCVRGRVSIVFDAGEKVPGEIPIDEIRSLDSGRALFSRIAAGSYELQLVMPGRPAILLHARVAEGERKRVVFDVPERTGDVLLAFAWPDAAPESLEGARYDVRDARGVEYFVRPVDCEEGTLLTKLPIGPVRIRATNRDEKTGELYEADGEVRVETDERARLALRWRPR